MKSYEIIRELQATSSKNEKIEIVKRGFLSGNREFFIGARLAYDALTTFGVKKVVKIDDEDDGNDGVAKFSDFMILADRLRTRDLSGHAARDAIDAFSERCGIAEWNDFYRRVLLKDLKVGATESTINKALKDVAKTDAEAAHYIIPTYACQLAPSESYNRNTIGELKGRVYIDVKYDGIRLNTVLDKESGTVTQYTRAGLVNENFPHITEALTSLMADLPASVMIDGEVVGESFNALMKQATRTKGKGDTASTRLMVFDIVPLADFRAGYSPKTQEERHDVLTALQESGMFSKHTGDIAFVLPKVLLNLDTEDGKAELARMFDEVMRLRETDKKHEGLMAKKPDAPYRCKRWNAWEKVKPYVDASLEVIGLEQGRADTKNADSLGALICRGVDGEREIEVKVGSGFTEEDRHRWWKNPELVMGMIAEVEGHEFSQDEDSVGTSKWSIRHPRLKGWRGSKPGQKI